MAATRVNCESCDWRGQRAPRNPMDPNKAANASGFGSCPRCGGTVKRQALQGERQAAKAKADLAALEQGVRL